ncbi:MAG: MmcQ/YjbR family DNA-binding protein [Oscillospiraceae bacterium]
MKRQELIDYCLTFSQVIEDYPFEDGKSTIIRHINNRKWFAVIFQMNERLCINLKCEPMRADLLRSVYKDVCPAWHMNKTHWNTVILDGDVPLDELYSLIDESFTLTLQQKNHK